MNFILISTWNGFLSKVEETFPSPELAADYVADMLRIGLTKTQRTALLETGRVYTSGGYGFKIQEADFVAESWYIKESPLEGGPATITGPLNTLEEAVDRAMLDYDLSGNINWAALWTGRRLVLPDRDISVCVYQEIHPGRTVRSSGNDATTST